MDIDRSTVFKFTKESGLSPYGYMKWNLPNGKRPGKWMPKIKGELEACENGYHLCRIEDVLRWRDAVLWVAEYRGECVEAEDKIVVRQARLLTKVETWNPTTLRLFACDYAEYALNLVGNKADPRSIEAVRVARLYAAGKASKAELHEARSAAYSAYSDAYSAYSAYSDAYSAYAAYAAYSAAADAYSAAYAADAASAARKAAREWQTERLLGYLRGEIGIPELT